MPLPVKDDRVDLRITSDLKHLIEQAACLRGQSVSDFIRGAAIQGAHAVIQEAHVTFLSNRDREQFLAMLDDDNAAPNEDLTRAWSEFKAAFD